MAEVDVTPETCKFDGGVKPPPGGVIEEDDVVKIQVSDQTVELPLATPTRQ